MPRWAAVAVLFGSSALACSETASPSNPSVVAEAGGANPVVPTAGASGDEAGDAGTGLGSGAPTSSEGEQPDLVRDGAGASAAVDAGGVGASDGVGDAGGAEGTAGSGGVVDEGWVPLFNGANLDGWAVHGTTEPLFAVENGEIHVYPTQADQSEQPQANLRNLTLLGGSYELHVEYKWGEARFSDRRQTARDAGILFHVTGDVTRVWPDSIECQIGSSPVNGDWVTGDLWVLGTPTYAQVRDGNGQLQTQGGGYGFGAASAQAENPEGEWNLVDVVVNGSSEAIYIVNGVEVNRVFNMMHDGQPLAEGFVSVQAEYAELFYRNIRYRLNE